MGELAWLEPLRSSSAVVVLKDADDVIVWANDAAVSMADLDGGTLIGKTPADVLGPQNTTQSLEVGRRVIKERRKLGEVRALMLDGVERWFDVRHAPVQPERTEGRGWCVLVHAVEVTAQVQLAAMNAMLGLRKRGCRPIEGDEAFVRLLLSGSTMRDLCTALNMSVDEVSSRLIALAGTPV